MSIAHTLKALFQRSKKPLLITQGHEVSILFNLHRVVNLLDRLDDQEDTHLATGLYVRFIHVREGVWYGGPATSSPRHRH
jgi:hypothetical protein